MTHSRFNTVFSYFLLSQLVFVPVHFYYSPMIAHSLNTDTALALHLTGLFWAVVGYLTAKYALLLRSDKGREEEYSLSSLFFVASYLFIFVGLIVSAFQVAMFVPLEEYSLKLLTGDYEQGLRDAYLLSSEEGGLPGILKMFAYAPLSVYLMSLGLLHFSQIGLQHERELKRLGWVALAAVIVKVFFSLDRLTILAVLLANLYIGIRQGYVKLMQYLLLGSVLLVIADYVSKLRMEDYGILDFALLYLKVGLVNLQLMVSSCTNHTWGFSTIFSPLLFILKFAGLPLPDLNSEFVWEWNPAQYFTSYAFQDFGYFYFIAFYVLGALLYYVHDRVERGNPYNSATYFIILYGVVSFIVVPAIRGIDFWFALCLPILLLFVFRERACP